MPQFSSTPNLEVFYSSDASGSNEYGYNTLSMISGIPDVSQLQLIWKVAIVLNSSGNPVAVSSFSDAEQEILQTLSDSMYNVDADSKKVTLIPSTIAGGEVTLNGAVYTYDSPFAGVSSADPLYIRRSTDVTSRAVIFQPGSRLTEELLNTSSAQVFNAMQELTAFGSGGGGAVGSIDLEDNSINDLGDVNLTTDGILYWDGSGVNTNGGTGGLVPDPNSAQDGMVITRTSPGSSLYDWEFPRWDKVLSSTNVPLDSQISTMSGSIQANTNAVAAASAESVPTYAVINPNNLSEPGETSLATLGVGAVNIFNNGVTIGNTKNFGGMSSAPVKVGSSTNDGTILTLQDSAGNDFFAAGMTDNGAALFKRSGVYRIDLSGIFYSGSASAGTGGFKIIRNVTEGNPYGINPIAALPPVDEGSEFISNSFLIPVNEIDVTNETTFTFVVSCTANTLKVSRVQFCIQRIGPI